MQDRRGFLLSVSGVVTAMTAGCTDSSSSQNPSTTQTPTQESTSSGKEDDSKETSTTNESVLGAGRWDGTFADTGHTASNTGITPPDSLSKQWGHNTGLANNFAAGANNGKIYWATDEKFTTYDAVSGEAISSTNINSTSSLHLDDASGRVAVIDKEYNLSTFGESGEFQTRTSIALDGYDRILDTAVSNGTLHLLWGSTSGYGDNLDGLALQTVEFTSSTVEVALELSPGEVIQPGRLMIVPTDSGLIMPSPYTYEERSNKEKVIAPQELVRLDTKAGKLVKVTSPFIESLYALQGGDALVSGAETGIYDIQADSMRWKVQIASAKMALGSDIVALINDSKGHLAAYDRKTGKQLWTFSRPQDVIGQPLITDDAVYTATENAVHLVNKSDGSHIASAEPSRRYQYSRKLAVNGRLVIASDNGIAAYGNSS